MKPFFETSDTGSKVYLYEGEPEYLAFEINDSTVQVSLPIALEMFKLWNGIWYSGSWRLLNICNSSMCARRPSTHIRNEICPQMTDYEKKLYDEYVSEVRGMHMAENRPPIANGKTSDQSQ